MEPGLRAITWDAPEHHHTEKTGDWYFAFVVVVISLVVSAVLFGNTLLALLLAIAGVVLSIAAARRPRTVTHSISVRGVRIGDEFYPFSQLLAYYIDEDDPKGVQLLLLSSRHFLPLIILSVPEEYIDDIEAIVREKLPEEHLEESFFTKLLEIFGF